MTPWLKIRRSCKLAGRQRAKGQVPIGAIFEPQSSPRPKKALIAVAASILTIVYHMLRDGTCYRDLGPEYFVRRNPAKLAAKLANPQPRLLCRDQRGRIAVSIRQSPRLFRTPCHRSTMGARCCRQRTVEGRSPQGCAQARRFCASLRFYFNNRTASSFERDRQNELETCPALVRRHGNFTAMLLNNYTANS